MPESHEHYRAERDALLKADRALRADYARTNTVMETQADQIVRRIRINDAETVWSAKHDQIPCSFPGMEFLTGRSTIQKTKLFQTVAKMPKGALLHVHLDLALGVKNLLGIALRHPAIHISVPEPITSDNLASIQPVLKPIPKNPTPNVTSLTDPVYNPDTWVSLTTARENFDVALGGPDGFDRWLVSKMIINSNEAYITHNDNIRIWEVFRSTITLIFGLVYYFPLWKDYLRDFLRETFEDGISYVEARINFVPKYMIGANGEEIPHIEWLEAFNFIVNQFKRENPGFFGAKIIYTVLRDCSRDVMEDHIEDCIRMKQAFPDLIVGFDMGGDENILHTLDYYLNELLAFKLRQQELGVDIPFLFHAGETCGDGTQADHNLYDAILLGTKRIGHGFSLVKHPRLMQVCREKGIALEVCPVSNEILRLTASMPMHPLPILLNHGVPVALSSDDPGVFQNTGLSFDFYQVLVTSELTGLPMLGHLARDSILHSALGETEKGQLMQLWETQWKVFIEDLVASNKN